MGKIIVDILGKDRTANRELKQYIKSTKKEEENKLEELVKQTEEEKKRI